MPSRSDPISYYQQLDELDRQLPKKTVPVPLQRRRPLFWRSKSAQLAHELG